VRNTDAAGNISGTTNNASELIVDTVVPANPVVAFPSSPTNITTITVTKASDAVSWEYSVNTGSGENWVTGVGTTFTINQGTYAINDIKVRNTDAAGNVSGTTNNASELIVDTVVPINPVVAFPSSPTINGTVTVTKASDTVSWEYSIDIGVTWLPGGLGTTFVLGHRTYAINDIQVRNTDAAGNVSGTTKNAFELIVDTVVPANPVVAFPSSPTNNGTVTVTKASDTVSWEYSLDIGVNWNTGVGITFLLPEKTYAINDIQVRNTDAAGNVSGKTNNVSELIVDTTVPDNPTVVFPSGITNTNIVTLTLASNSIVWAYSINDGDWIVGSNTSFSFTLDDGAYSIGAIKVRNTDAAGNNSIDSNPVAFTIDTVPPAPPQVDFPTSSYTNHPKIDVTLSQDTVSWEYSLDGGQTWLQMTV